MSFLREANAEPLPGYRLIQPLGSGGFGEVWKCEAPGGLFKAIKFVFGNLNSLDIDGARAEQELQALNRVREVRHPFILSTERIEVVEGELVIVMELADKSLHDTFHECQGAGLVGIPRETLLRYIRDAAEALDHMNDKHNLQHLDIKPRNLFLVSDRVKVADFGLVKHLERSGGSVLGAVTPLYAPPETFGGKISDRSDQYSLAIVYQELLTGQRPFNGKNPRTLAHQHINEQPELRSLPEAERPVIARALAKDPNKRFPNCLAFVRALYNARPAVPSALVLDDGGGRRPKTLHDTLEDILLEKVPGHDRSQRAPGESAALADSPNEASPVDAEPAAEGAAVSDLGMTIPQPQTGALRPTIVLGLGSFGRRALLELRCRLLDRFGDLDKLPVLRFLYVDTDSEETRAALRGPPEVALRPGEIYHLSLQPISHYRRRQLDHLGDWLPREKLFALPRSLKTQGSRGLGRLAFADHYLRLLARIRREVQQAGHADSIYQAVAQTGLALRDATPRVYVLAAATGGASGYLPDLGYALRRQLKQLQHPEAPVSCFLFCGAPDDPATPPPEQANLYATLTELNHFADPALPFTAQYGADGPRLAEAGAAFDSTYLLAMRHRTPECRRDVMAHLGSYLFHELTTPLGLRLDRARAGHPGCSGHAQSLSPKSQAPTELAPALGGAGFRSLGTFGVWFPRGLLLRLAARGACGRLLEEWQAPGPPTARAELEAAQARVLADAEWQPEVLAARIAELAGGQLEGSPRDALTRLLATIEEQSQQSVAHDDPGGWARQALGRLQDWLGGGLPPPGVTAFHQRKSRLTRALEAAAAKLADDWDRRLGEVVASLLEHPGRRLAVAEAALASFTTHCQEASAAQAARCQQQAQRTQQAREQLAVALECCIEGAGGFSWFGSRSRRGLRVFVDHLAAFARQCLAEDSLVAVQHFFGYLSGKLADRARDLTFCRQRLRHVQESLERWSSLGDEGAEADPAPAGALHEWPAAPSRGEAVDLGGPAGPTPLLSAEGYWDTLSGTATMRVVLPPETGDLAEAARRFLQTLTPEQWTQLDQACQDHVLAARGGLFKACMGTADLVRNLSSPMILQAGVSLSDHLPVTDVADVELAVGQNLAERLRDYHDRAVPLLLPAPAERERRLAGSGVRSAVAACGPGTGVESSPEPPAVKAERREHSFLLVPASDAGKRFGELARQALPGLHLVNAPGQAGLTFCREQADLHLEDLQRLLAPCRAAYGELAVLPQTSPHARFDVQDWIPLDP
jgi:serine/threonine protein kinase